VVVPVVEVDLDEADAALDQAARHEDRVGEAARLLRVLAVELERDSGSFERSVSSGTLACMRNAISYWLVRVRVSGPASAGN
jgi:hypothetical protein